MAFLQKLVNEINGKRAMTFLIVVIIAHVILMMVHLQTSREARDTVRREELIQKIMNAIFLVKAAPVVDRQNAVLAMSDPDIHVFLSHKPAWSLQFKDISFWDISRALRHNLHPFAISIQMGKGQWLNLRARLYSHVLLDQLILLALELIVLSSIFMTLWAINRFTQPLKQFKQAAEQLGIDLHSKPLRVMGGPLVVREAAEAMNKMQKRVQELINDRTQMLAAISHDLRTPITRMKLRSQFIEESSLQTNFISDLDEMEKMISETLSFAREDSVHENKVTVDLVSLLSTITHEMQDMNQSVIFHTQVHRAPVIGQTLALKRAFTNLINNGIRYGNQIDIQLNASRNKGYLIIMEDDGPGIPEKELEQVFAPFYRLESSRSRNTGGVGLGLAVARDIFKAHNAKITLCNRKPKGLRVTIEFL